MTRLIFFLTRPRLWGALAAAAVSFFVLAWATDDRTLIVILTMVQIALAANVVIAFTPAVVDIVCDTGPIDRVSTLILGVWISWGAVLYRAAESLIWRILGEPGWLINSDITSAYLVMGCTGALLHIAVPDSLHDRVPPRKWVQIGAVVAIAIFVGLAVVYSDEISGAVRGMPHVQSEAPPAAP